MEFQTVYTIVAELTTLEPDYRQVDNQNGKIDDDPDLIIRFFTPTEEIKAIDGSTTED